MAKKANFSGVLTATNMDLTIFALTSAAFTSLSDILGELREDTAQLMTTFNYHILSKLLSIYSTTGTN